MLFPGRLLSFVLILFCFQMNVRAQTNLNPVDSGPLSEESGYAALLPTDHFLRNSTEPALNEQFPSDIASESRFDDPVSEQGQSPELPRDLKSLMKPRFDFAAEWEPEAGGVGISSYDLSMKLPLYPIFGPPPPFLTAGYSFTQIEALPAFDLPENLHQFTLGMSWMRRINEKWMTRTMLNGVFASDLNNTGSMAWQFRGGFFALYRPNDIWNIAIGALATGQEDIPVIPVLGAIWEPNPRLKINLMLPNPRVSFLLSESERRQHWGYVGGGMSGGNWAYQRNDGSPEQLNYREWRFVLGWESMPPKKPGSFGSTGRKFLMELGYVFGRKFELERNATDIKIENTLLLHSGLSF
ncbi:MAG: DUF6268 family outer membrane beta-barrel protein [Gimesia sp.]|nr:DUF6268 family outer membrane beta-barrel protein [Gimesia sp.]